MCARRVVVASFVAWVGCESAPAMEEPPPCDRLLDHVTEIRSQRVGAIAGAPQAVARRKQALARALGDDYLAACEAAPEATVECLLAATTARELDACPHPVMPGSRIRVEEDRG